MKTSIAIYGFGRMGLTHHAILNQLIKHSDFTFIDVDKRLNFFARKNINAKIVTSDKSLLEPFDYSLICTPPMFHVPIIENCLKRGDNKIFAEKPFGGIQDNFEAPVNNSEKIKVGYVMRFNPIINWVKNYVKKEDVVRYEGSYFSNTIEKKPKGWRNGEYSGVCNEMGSHIIDFAVYLLGLNEPEILNKNVKSVISDVDDIVDVNLKADGVDYNFHFDWVNQDYRKPVFKLNIYLVDGTRYKIDQQKVEIIKNDELIDSISTVDVAEDVSFYLRGVDFTKQMQDLIGDQHTLASVEEAMVTRKLIKDILS